MRGSNRNQAWSPRRLHANRAACYEPRVSTAFSRMVIVAITAVLAACSSKAVHKTDADPGSDSGGRTSSNSNGGVGGGVSDSGGQSSGTRPGDSTGGDTNSAVSAGGADDSATSANTGAGGEGGDEGVGGSAASGGPASTTGWATGGYGGSEASSDGSGGSAGETAASTDSGSTFGGSASATTSPSATCPNGEVEGDEECDDGEATVACSANCTSCVPPSPMTVVDQELGFCTSACVEGWVGNGQTVAQQFRVSQSGALASVELYVVNHAAEDNDIHLQLVDAGASANLLSGRTPAEIEPYVVGTATVQGSSSGFAWERFDFSSQDITLDPSKHYVLWLSMLPTETTHSSVNVRWNLWDDATFADPYPDGRPYFCPPESPCQLEPQPHFDYAFRVRLTPPVPLCE